MFLRDIGNNLVIVYFFDLFLVLELLDFVLVIGLVDMWSIGVFIYVL